MSPPLARTYWVDIDYFIANELVTETFEVRINGLYSPTTFTSDDFANGITCDGIEYVKDPSTRTLYGPTGPGLYEDDQRNAEGTGYVYYYHTFNAIQN